jgi:UDP:flavonoid glycosyltransferase YjiC (YdhE family)
MFDQIYWGQRIASLGVGPEPIGIRKLTANRLAKVIELSINDPVMLQKAQVLSLHIQAEDGIQRAVDLVNEHLKNPNISR